MSMYRAVGLAGLFLALVLAVSAAPMSGGNKLLCFSGSMDYPGTYNGICTIEGSTATLDNNDGDLDPYNNYAGVYIGGSNLFGKLLADIGQLSFRYTGTATAGSPRISLPLDTDGDGTTDFYAFVSAYYCDDGAGLVDVRNDATCTIYAGSESFANWAEMIATHPTWRVSEDLAFIIADDPGIWTVSDVRLGKSSRTTGK